MLDMLKSPDMQRMLYPYLPEPMRNPETFEWMLNSPEHRAQLEAVLAQQMGGGGPGGPGGAGGAPGGGAVADMFAGVDMSPDRMRAQFDSLGMTPEAFVQKVRRGSSFLSRFQALDSNPPLSPPTLILTQLRF